MVSVGLIRFYGLSTDAKPTTTSTGGDLVAGCHFTETDTGRQSYWNGAAWFALGLPAGTTDPAVMFDLLTTDRLILRELRLLRQGMMRTTVAAEYDGPPEELDEPQ